MGLLVSVIVPTHQRFAMFVKCIYSLAAQSFPKDEYEVIAVHDGLEHDYNAGEIEHLKGLFGNFSFHAIPKGGASAARNHALSIAKGEIVLMTDDDCVASPEWIGAMVRFLHNHPEVVAVGGQVLAVTPKTFVETYISDKNLLRRPVRDVNGSIVTLITANVAYRRSVLDGVGGFSDVFTNNEIASGGEDLDLAFRAATTGPLAYCETAIVYHHHRSSVRALARQHFNYGRGVFVACANNSISYSRVRFSRPTRLNLLRHSIISFVRLFTISVPEFWTKRIPLWKWPAYFGLDLLRRNVFMAGAVYEFRRQGGDDHEIR